MKKLVVLFSIPLLLFACKSETKSEKETTTAANDIEVVEVDEFKQYPVFGKEFAHRNTLTKKEAVNLFKHLKTGDTAFAKFETKVNEVCQEKGCWMRLDLDDDEVMVKFKDYGFFMPKNIKGKEVIVNGKAYISEVSVEEQRHYAKDAGKNEDEIAAITVPKKTLSFEADGVLLKE